MPKFEVIIPVVNLDLADLLLISIERNSILPKKIIIINNSKETYIPFVKNLSVEMFYSKTGRVNESISLGISKLSEDCEYVSILNDDLILGPLFFERMTHIFKTIEDCAVACPTQVFDISQLVTGGQRIIRMKKREGPAMTFRKSILDKIPSIPYERVHTFYGDDWFWIWTIYKLGKGWYKDTGNKVYHKVGSSIRKLGFRGHKRPEFNEWRKIIKELGQGVEF